MTGLKENSLRERIVTRWNNIEKSVKWAFFACLISGLLFHLFAFTNMIPNSDGISRLNDPQQMTVVGRWFLHYATWFNAYTQMPMLIGVLSLLFLSTAAALTVCMLRVQNIPAAVLIGVQMTAIPAMAYTYLYMFTASAYCFSILLATVAVYACEKTRFGWLWGSLILALAVGIYQTYITVAISLCLLLVLRFALEHLDDPKSILLTGLKKIGFLALGMVVYYLVLQIFLRVKNLELLSYLNMNDTLLNYPLRSLPSILKLTYVQVFRQFYAPHGYVNIAIIVSDFVLLICALVCIVISVVRAEKRRVWSIVMLVGVLLLLPLGINFTQVMNPSSAPTPIMQYSFVYPVILVLTLLPELSLSSKHIRTVCKVAGLAAVLLLSLKYAQVDNLCYTASLQAHRATESFATRLVARIEQAEGYEAGMEVAIIGGYPEEYYTSPIASFETVKHYSCLPETVTPLNKQIYYYFNNWLNVPINEPPEDTLIAVSGSAEFAAMPLYPSDGSVQVVNGMVIVKLAESYTPKQQYEIDYENRR